MDKREIIVLVALVGFCLLLGFYLQYLSISLSTEDYPLVQTQNRINQLHNQNINLRNELLEKTSYNYIYQVATKWGFVPAPLAPL